MLTKIIFLLFQLCIVIYLIYKEKKEKQNNSALFSISALDIFPALVIVNLFTFIQYFLHGILDYQNVVITAYTMYIIVILYVFYLLRKKQKASIKSILFQQNITLLQFLWFFKVVLILGLLIYLVPALILKTYGIEYYTNKFIKPNIEWFNPIRYIYVNSPGYIYPLMFFTIIISPLAEELLYRKIIYTYLIKMFSVRKAFILTTVLFYLLHYSFPNIKIILFGCLYLWVFQRTSSVLLCVITHSIRNTQLLIDYYIWIKKDNIESILLFIGMLMLIAIIIKKKYFIQLQQKLY